MAAYCRNCKKAFNAKNALFCSTSCYEFYTDALEKNVVVPLENDAPQIARSANFPILMYDQIHCGHEYSKNGTMSCKKCGRTNVA
jgi:hypothetical protein